MMTAHDGYNRMHLGNRLQDFGPHRRVLLHLGEFFRSQFSGFSQYGVIDADFSDVVKRSAQLDEIDLFVGKLEFLRQHHGVFGDTLSMTARVSIAKFNRLGQDIDGFKEEIALFLEELRSLDGRGNVSRQSIGQQEVVFGEWLLDEIAVEMQYSEPLSRCAQQNAHDAGHGAVGDALRELRLVVAVERAV